MHPRRAARPCRKNLKMKDAKEDQQISTVENLEATFLHVENELDNLNTISCSFDVLSSWSFSQLRCKMAWIQRRH